MWPFLSICILSVMSGLQSLDISLQVPAIALRGDNITLRCSYDLEGEMLYMVKWYKGPDEFFRFTPKEKPHVQVFPTPGVQVNMNKSDDDQVFLSSVQKSTSGKYRVEVTTDAPMFYTAIESAHLEVIEPPTGAISLLVERPQYSLGDTLRATCWCPLSSPPMNITWYIQGEEINRRHPSVHRITQGKTSYHPISIESNIQYQVNQFKGGKFSLVCEGTLYDVVRLKASRDIYEKKPRVSPVVQKETGPVGSAGARRHVFRLLLLFSLLLLMADTSNI